MSRPTHEEGPGINGALSQRGEAGVVTLTMDVDSIEQAAARVVEKGGRVLQGKMAIPSIGWYATCEDTEGNRFGLFTSDSSATM